MSKILAFIIDSISKSNVGDNIWQLYSTLLIFVLFCIFLRLIQNVRYNLRLPPGPSGYPILGMLPKIKKEFHLQLFDYTKSFGKIISLKMGNQLIVVLSDHKLIKAAFGKSEFAARPKTEFGNILGGYGIINAEGHLWKTQRKFLHQQKFGMKHWGMGSAQIEERVTQEVKYFLNAIKDSTSNPMNPAPILNCAISNVICSIIMSTRFHHEDKQFTRFMQLFDEGFRLFNLTGALVFLPVLKHLPGTTNALNALKANRDEMLKFVQYIIQDHKATLNPDHPRDLVDSYLIDMGKDGADVNNTNDKDFDEMKQLEQIILDIFSAGVETLKTTLQWAILFMIHNPDVRTKVQEEIESVVGSKRLPCMDDMAKLNYTKATIYEVMRRSTVVPMGTTHATDRTVELEGHIIPKDTHVIPLLHGVHMDPEVWEEPEAFRPERFLTEEGKVHKPKHFMPFGAGQRMCLGDKIAEMELQLFFSSLLHTYNLENPGKDLPSLQGFTGVTVSPHDFEVNFIPRNLEALSSLESQKSVNQWSKHIRLYDDSKNECLSI